MKTLPLFRYTLTTGRRTLAGWAIAVAAVLGMYMLLFPSIGGNASTQQLINSLPQQFVQALGLQQIASGSGYMQSTFFGLMGFVLLTIAALSWGTTAIAGDEEAGTLELTLAHAASRARVVTEQTLALVTRLLALSVVTVIVVAALNSPAKTDLSFANVLATTAAMLGIALLCGLASLATGAVTGRRSIALGVGAAIAALSYILNALGAQVTDGKWLKDISPYSWAFGNTPLINGADGSGLAMLYGVCAVLFVVALVAFNRRDVTA